MTRVRRYGCSILVLWLLAGCRSAAPQPATAAPTADWSQMPGAEVAFQRVINNDFGHQDHYEARTPGLATIASDADRAIHETLIESAAAAQSFDSASSIMIIVFNGWRPTTGYAIRVEQVRATTERVIIIATASEPAPDQTTGQAVTSPYEIIAIPRPAGRRGPVTFQLFLNGRAEAAAELVKIID